MSLTPIDPSAEYFDLGTFTRRITTTSPSAQTWFNRGLTWAYAFNHDEASTCFEQVVAHDPKCAIAYWGIAYANGPNYNKSWKAFDSNDLKASMTKCHSASAKAREYARTNASLVERALIEAVQRRFPVEYTEENLSASNEMYAEAMRKVYMEFGDDLDVLVLTADALMNTAPWQLFEPRTGRPKASRPALEIKQILDRGMQFPGANQHPGLLHLYIHLMEMSTTPESALVAADQLRTLCPDGGHLQHMPSHIYILIGDYRQAMDANTKASLANDKFFARYPKTQFYVVYRLHDFHSLSYAAMMAGQSRIALEASECMQSTITEEMLTMKSPPMGDWIEFFNSVRVHVLIRFGMWDAIKTLPIPDKQDVYCVTIATIHYGKGLAWAATGNIEEAEEERDLFRTAAKRVPPTRSDFPNIVVDELKVADAMLDGEIEYRRGNFDAAFEHLRTAIKHDDSLVYSEPWGWMIPTRHAFAALSLERGNVEDAAKAYAEDLGLEDSLASAHQHPMNIWSLRGYHECLLRLGRTSEARMIMQQLKVAEAVADVEVKASCFCSVTAGAVPVNRNGCGSC